MFNRSSNADYQITGLLAREELFDGDPVDGHAGDIAVGEFDAGEVAVDEFAVGEGTILEFHGSHLGAFDVEGVIFGWHTDVVNIRAADLGAFDLEVAEVGVDDLHVAGVDIIDNGSAEHDVVESAVAHAALVEAGFFEVEFGGFDAGF